MIRAEDVAAGLRQVEHASLLTRAMIEHLFPDARIRAEGFLGLTKSFVAIRDPAADR